MLLKDGEKEFDDMYISFDTIPECDRQIDGFAVIISRSACIGILTHDKDCKL